MKNVLLLVHDDAGQESRLQAALDLTRALSGHLACLDAAELPVVVDGLMGGGMSFVMADERDREASNKARLWPRLAAEDVSWSWNDTVGDLPSCIADAARTADLIVLSRQLDELSGPDMRYIATEVLTRARALVAAVADTAQGFDTGGKALIAWDGSDRAMSTVQRAVPLLALAREVKLFQVGEIGADAIPVEEAAAYLSRHGIHAEAQIAPKAQSIAVAIRMEADEYGAAWLVMGAYNHAPLREALFGGVTRAMLTACSLPLVLGH